MKSIADRNCPFCHMTPIQTRSTSPDWNGSTDPASRSVSSVQIGGLAEWLVWQVWLTHLYHCGTVAVWQDALALLWHCGTVVSETLLPDWVREHQSFFGSVPPCRNFQGLAIPHNKKFCVTKEVGHCREPLSQGRCSSLLHILPGIRQPFLGA